MQQLKASRVGKCQFLEVVADVAFSKDSVNIVYEQFHNTVYCFSLGKHVAYSVVENYVKNTWSKFGLVKTYDEF